MSVRSLSQQLDYVQSTLGLTEVALAGVLKTSPRVVRRWRTGESYPDKGACARLDALEALADRLHQTFTTDRAIQTWLGSNSRYLSHVKPMELLKVQRLDRVNAALEAIDSGYVS